MGVRAASIDRKLFQSWRHSARWMGSLVSGLWREQHENILIQCRHILTMSNWLILTKDDRRGDIMALSKNPEVTIEIVTSLYYGPQRAGKLVEMVQENLDVSEPTVYGVLLDLAERGFVEKVVRSRRNVSYKLTDKGKDLIQREHFDAIGDIMALIKSAKRKRELLIELLIEDIMEGLPEDWDTDERKAVLRRSMDEEVDLLKRRMVMMSNAANPEGA